MSTYFLMIPGYWSKSTSPAKCWKHIRRMSGRTMKQARKNEYFMLEFAQDNLHIDVNEVTGSWHADGYPVRLVEHNKISTERLRQFAAWCKEGLKRYAASQGSDKEVKSVCTFPRCKCKRPGRCEKGG